MKKNIFKFNLAYIDMKSMDRLAVGIGASSMVPERGVTPYGLVATGDEALYNVKKQARDLIPPVS